MNMILRSWIVSNIYMLRRLLPRKRGVLVLAYHSVDTFDDEYTISRETFVSQLDEIARAGLRVISITELERMLERGSVEDGTVVLTFDDGRRDNYVNLFPIIRARNIPITIFSITGDIGKARESSVRMLQMLSESEMREMHDSGLVDFQPHTETHPKLTTISLDDVRHEITASKLFLEKIFGKICPYFAYPYGRTSADIKRIVGECAIHLAFATEQGFVTTSSDHFALPRNHVRHDTTRLRFKSMLKRGSLR